MIERFHHIIGSGVMTYERSFNASNDIIFTPNDVAVVGRDEFFVTNVSHLNLNVFDLGRIMLRSMGFGVRRRII